MRIKSIHWALLTLIVLLGGSIFIYIQTRPEESVSSRTSTVPIGNFDECVQAGNATMESNPRQCRTDAGNLFVESVDETTVDTAEYVSRKGTRISLSQPLSKDVLVSPIVVKGLVPGNWSSEGNFPVTILDSTGVTIAETTAKLSGDWMTEEYVPFEATLTFSVQVGGGNGTMVIKKANPSGEIDKNDLVLIPVSF